ncbi:MAG: hypothetical protein NTY36_01415 [Deltaproteobacteria bacterium]|nr:hypothetical protein [Deltaproteobacteria bacterium]
MGADRRAGDRVAVLFDDGCTGLKVYLPRSQIAVVHQADGTVMVTMPEWLAKKKGLY